MMIEQKIFDLGFLEQMDDTNFIAEVIVLYLRDTDKDLKEMQLAFQSGPIDTVYKMAHKLKGSTGMLQANALFTILEETEKLARAGKTTSELGKLVQMARNEFNKLKPALELHLQGMQTPA